MSCSIAKTIAPIPNAPSKNAIPNNTIAIKGAAITNPIQINTTIIARAALIIILCCRGE